MQFVFNIEVIMYEKTRFLLKKIIKSILVERQRNISTFLLLCRIRDVYKKVVMQT